MVVAKGKKLSLGNNKYSLINLNEQWLIIRYDKVRKNLNKDRKQEH